MNDPWDVKCVRQSGQYMSCIKINGVPLLPPVLSKECRKEMQYYKLLAKEVEKRISALKPYITESDSEPSENKTDAPDLPVSEQSSDLSEAALINLNNNCKNITTEKCLEDCEIVSPKHPSVNENHNTITSNFTIDTDSIASQNSSKFVIDLSVSIGDSGKSTLNRSIKSIHAPIDVPERDCEYQKNEHNLLTDTECNIRNKKTDKLNFSISVNKDILSEPLPNLLAQDGPSSLSSKSFTGSLNNIYTECVKESKIPLIRQRSYTVLTPSPLLLAHLEVQSLSTGVEMTSISMSESLSNLSSPNKKRRSWDLESAKVKWSTMALELKQKNLNYVKNSTNKTPTSKPLVRKNFQTAPRAKSLVQEKPKRIIQTPKSTVKSEPFHKNKKSTSPIRNPNQNGVKSPPSPKSQTPKPEAMPKSQLISESEDPATRVRELYEKIQKQQQIQMATLVEKQKREQMLLHQVFEEQNNLLYNQLKTICPKSQNETKEAWVEKEMDRGPVSLSQLISHKSPEQSVYNSPVSTLTDTNNYINHCDTVLKKSRDITGSLKRHQTQSRSLNGDVIQSPKNGDGNRTRTHSPTLRNTSTSRKLVYETSVSSDHEYDNILTDRTNDTMADLNVTFPSDHSDDGNYQNLVPHYREIVEVKSPVLLSSSRSTDKAIRSMENTIHNSINNVPGRKQPVSRVATAKECAAASTIVAYAKGYLVRRLMRTERVQATVQTIKDALLCALQLHQDREGIRGADVDLHRRLIQQITAACYSLHDTFVASTAAERCGLVAADRARRRSLASRPPPPPPHPHPPHRPTDIMSQSHSGAFPSRYKRPPASLMTQSNYETFSGEKSVSARYLPSPRRRPWR